MSLVGLFSNSHSTLISSCTPYSVHSEHEEPRKEQAFAIRRDGHCLLKTCKTQTLLYYTTYLTWRLSSVERTAHSGAYL
jgi:hypothetical protein